MDRTADSIAALLTYSEVAEILKVKVATLKKWVSTERIPYCKLGRCVRFTESQVQWMIRHASIGDMEVDT